MDCTACHTPLPADARFCMACGADVTDPGATIRTKPRDAMAELQDRLARTLAGRYDVKKLLGAGGMAAVYLAEEIGLDRPVAIKVLPPELSRDEGLVARFQREAKTAAKLDHPHIIPIHRVESEAGLHYFVMKYVPGRSLDDLLEAERVPIDVATRILREAASALGHAHARGVVHRDVKPANIMLDADDRVVLTDFGISKAGESTHLTQTGTIIGTPHYMAPEQALGGEIDGRADQYALGIVAYQMLTGQCPFLGDSAHTIIYRHIHDVPPPVGARRPDVPAHLADAVAAALSKDPAERFATMEEFARALAGDAAALPRRPSAPGPRPPATGRSSAGQPTPSRAATVALDAEGRVTAARPRRMHLAVAASLAGAIVVVGSAWMAMKRESTPTPTLAQAPLPVVVDSASERERSAASTEGPGPRAEGRAAGALPEGRAARAEPKEPVRRAAAARAPLTVASEPYGTLFIDDVEIGDTPVANHQLEVGRRYRIKVVREGYRSKGETIAVEGPNPIRLRYILEPGGQP
jgi:serine/threonine-protein kinase